MKIWILKNGERSGPHETFSIRERISEGELDADTPAWYEGIPEWVTLEDVPSLHGLFTHQHEEVSEQEIIEETAEATIIHAPQPLHPVQRFFARFFDIFVYRLIIAWIQLLSGINPLLPPDTPMAGVMLVLPYVIIDAIMMHIWGTTPGKTLLGIRVTTAEGNKLSIGASLLRSLRVWILGFGMFFIWFISLPISFLIAKKFGKFVWDVPKNYQISAKPLVTSRVVIYVFILLILSSIVSSFFPEEIKNATTEELLEMATPKEK